MSDLEAMCQSLAETCTMATGFAVRLEDFSTRAERARDDVRHVAGSSASVADLLSDASRACVQAADTLRRTAQVGTEYVAHVRG